MLAQPRVAPAVALDAPAGGTVDKGPGALADFLTEAAKGKQLRGTVAQFSQRIINGHTAEALRPKVPKGVFQQVDGHKGVVDVWILPAGVVIIDNVAVKSQVPMIRP